MQTGIITQPAEQYHAADGVSRSMLNVLFEQTPMHYRSRFILKETEKEETPAMRLGTLTHRCILEPDSMAGAFHTKPHGMNFATTEGKAWKKERADKPIISLEEHVAMIGMRDAVWRHPLASRMLKKADFERSAFADHDGMLLKARFDAMPPSGNVLPDIKTCEDASLDKVEKSINEYLYWRQAAFYLKVAKLLSLPFEIFAFIFVEKTPPYAVAVYQLDDLVLEAGTSTINRDIQLLRNCIEKNEWPGYPNEIGIAALPGYAMKRLENEL